jgi:hypothetical protein
VQNVSGALFAPFFAKSRRLGKAEVIEFVIAWDHSPGFCFMQEIVD